MGIFTLQRWTATATGKWLPMGGGAVNGGHQGQEEGFHGPLGCSGGWCLAVMEEHYNDMACVFGSALSGQLLPAGLAQGTRLPRVVCRAVSPRGPVGLC